MRFWVLLGLLMAGHVQAEPAWEVVKQSLTQGGFVVGKVDVGATVRLGDAPVPVGRDGLFVVGFDRFASPTQVVEVCRQALCSRRTLALTERVYDVQHVKGVPAKTVDPDPKQVARMKADNAAIAAARKVWLETTAFAEPFILPLNARTSGVYGSRRTYNGQERSWHKGHDLAAPTGTPVVAPARGVVRLARDTFMNGNLIIIDHGHQLTSLYAHLHTMDVTVGDVVTAGQRIGTVGTTGRSTGPHLHWGMNWKGVAIDPWLWIGHTAQKGG